MPESLDRQMSLVNRNVTRLMCLSIGLTMLALSSGCIGLVANLMHVAHGNLAPAKFTGLDGKKVAVVCVSNSEAFGPRPISPVVAEHVERLLEKHVADVEVVPQQSIADWIDQNDWDYLDFRAIGTGVDSELVLAIEIDQFSLQDGQTMYKGRADVSVVVYDVASGKNLFVHTPSQIQYPRNSGYHTTDMSARDFQRRFLAILAQRIARNFYSYDVQEDYAQDSSLISMLTF